MRVSLVLPLSPQRAPPLSKCFFCLLFLRFRLPCVRRLYLLCDRPQLGLALFILFAAHIFLYNTMLCVQWQCLLLTYLLSFLPSSSLQLL